MRFRHLYLDNQQEIVKADEHIEEARNSNCNS